MMTGQWVKWMCKKGVSTHIWGLTVMLLLIFPILWSPSLACRCRVGCCLEALRVDVKQRCWGTGVFHLVRKSLLFKGQLSRKRKQSESTYIICQTKLEGTSCHFNSLQSISSRGLIQGPQCQECAVVCSPISGEVQSPSRPYNPPRGSVNYKLFASTNERWGR